MKQKLALLVLVDVFLSLLAIFLATNFFIRSGAAFVRPLDMLIFTFVVLFSSYFLELYSRHKVYSLDIKDMLSSVGINFIISFFALSTIFFMLSSEDFGRRLIVSSLIIFIFLQLLWHYFFRTILSSSGMTQRVMILGTGDLARKMERIMLFKGSQYVFAGYYDIVADNRNILADSASSKCKDLAEHVKEHTIDKIVVAMEERRGTFPLKELLTCKFAGVEIVDSAAFYEEIMGKMHLENITPGWFIFSDGFKLSSTRKTIKRVMDILFSIMGIIMSFPLVAIISILIKCDSKGPIFYKQLRMGEGERNFLLYKFRTMREDAENGTGAVWAQENDKRITRVGSILRKLRLDEIPQFFNVLKGDMSFIGPRPERPEFVEQLKQTIPYYMNRHFVKPGISGLAQVRYRYGASRHDSFEKLCYDLYYIKHLSPLLDTAILIDTIKVVLLGKGAR